MPIHYDTIEDGQHKKSHLLFSFLVSNCAIFAFYRRDLLVKNIITSFQWFHLNNYTPYEYNCFYLWRPNLSRGIRHARKFRLRTDASRDMRCSRALNTQLPRVIAERVFYHVIVMDGPSCWSEPMKLLADYAKSLLQWLRICNHSQWNTSMRRCTSIIQLWDNFKIPNIAEMLQ